MMYRKSPIGKMKSEYYRKPITLIYCGFLILLTCNMAVGQESYPDTTKIASVRYTHKGFEFMTKDKKFLLQFQSRLQFRFATLEDQDPLTFDDFTGEKQPSFKINRARLKIG